MQDQQKINVLFVCLGNICRSPTAEGVFTKLVKDCGVSHRFRIDSAGTHDYHIGKPPDQRAQQAALNRGIDLSALRARQVQVEDFEEFDSILAMDKENLEGLLYLGPKARHHKVELFLDYAPRLGIREVPDPYFGGSQGFERVLDMVEEAANGLLDSLLAKRSHP
jgi:protein-tyrosine phosphatase